VRELKSAVESALIHSNGQVIQPIDLPPEIAGSLWGAGRPNPQDEREHVLAALRRANGNRTEAARLLGISRATLYRVLSRLNLPQAS
jgi:transcriptional regulator of acetoin/glycerol metabolism